MADIWLCTCFIGQAFEKNWYASQVVLRKCSSKPNLGKRLEIPAIITVHICSYQLFWYLAIGAEGVRTDVCKDRSLTDWPEVPRHLTHLALHLLRVLLLETPDVRQRPVQRRHVLVTAHVHWLLSNLPGSQGSTALKQYSQQYTVISVLSHSHRSSDVYC